MLHMMEVKKTRRRETLHYALVLTKSKCCSYYDCGMCKYTARM